MSEAKHTPGPWHLKGESNYSLRHESITASDGQPLFDEHDNAACGDPDCCGGYESWSEFRCDADARLIAAAPMLLEALEELVELFSGIAEGDQDGAITEARAAIDAAIAKEES